MTEAQVRGRVVVIVKRVSSVGFSFEVEAQHAGSTFRARSKTSTSVALSRLVAKLKQSHPEMTHVDLDGFVLEVGP